MRSLREPAAAWCGAVLALTAACGESHRPADSGVAPLDAGRDAGPDGSIPEPDAGPQVGCEGWAPDGDRACVPAGPFRFGFVVDQALCPSCGEDYLQILGEEVEGGGVCGCSVAHQAQTEEFLIDLREVSIAEYAAYLTATGASPPPAACEHVHLPYLGCSEVSTATGWSEVGEALPDWLDLPVTCVTKEEASAFCEWRGGALPDTLQWMKAARGPWPNLREYPWSEDQAAPWAPGPSYPLGMIAASSESPNGDPCEHIADLRRPDPVDSHHDAASPYGLLNVIGNAAEWVTTAATDDGYESSLTDVFSGPFTSESRFGVTEASSWTWYQISFGMSSVMQLDPGQTGAILRERTLGFRCAYPPE